jgi:hypothetical protein
MSSRYVSWRWSSANDEAHMVVVNVCSCCVCFPSSYLCLKHFCFCSWPPSPGGSRERARTVHVLKETGDFRPIPARIWGIVHLLSILILALSAAGVCPGFHRTGLFFMCLRPLVRQAPLRADVHDIASVTSSVGRITPTEFAEVSPTPAPNFGLILWTSKLKLTGGFPVLVLVLPDLFSSLSPAACLWQCFVQIAVSAY